VDAAILWTPWLLALLAGLALGSFANVLIHRVPTGGSLLRPSSSCPACGRRLRPWENIPLLSWLLLRARCAGCHAPISPRYPLVEGLVALQALLLPARMGLDWSWLLLLPALALLTALAFIDWDTQRLPDRLTLPLGLIGLAACAVQGLLALVGAPPLAGLPGPLDGLLGGLAGGGLLYAIAWIGWWILRREAMGAGDIKLMAAFGLLLGWQQTLLALLLGALAGSIAGVIQRGARFEERPFGPWLALGSIIALFWGDALIALYLGWVLG
jgi:leader peptidase (prepilin peptidase) / N-methyltransferase